MAHHLLVIGRGATVRNILDFPKQFPARRSSSWNRNYRSNQSILAATNAIIAQANAILFRAAILDLPSRRHRLSETIAATKVSLVATPTMPKCRVQLSRQLVAISLRQNRGTNLAEVLTGSSGRPSLMRSLSDFWLNLHRLALDLEREGSTLDERVQNLREVLNSVPTTSRALYCEHLLNVAEALAKLRNECDP